MDNQSPTESSPDFLNLQAQIGTSLEAIADASIYFTIATLALAFLAALMLQALHEFGLRRWHNRAATYAWLADRWATTFHHLKRFGAADEQFVMEAAELDPRRMLESLGIAADSAVFALPHAQFCAQLSNALQDGPDLSRAGPTLIAFAGLSGTEANPARSSESLLDNELSWLRPALGKPRDPRSSDGKVDVDRELLMLKIERGVDDLQSEISRRWSKSVYKWSAGSAVLLLAVLLLGAERLNAPFATTIVVTAIATGAALMAPPLQRLLGRLFDTE